MYKKILFALFAALSLAGCKVEHISQVTNSQVEGPMQTIQATARIEVAACKDYRDQSKPSSALEEANALVNQLFATSEFQGCKNEGFSFFATYRVPMDVGKVPAEGTWEAKNITIARNSANAVFFCVPQTMIDGMNTYKQRQPLAENTEFIIDITYVNDSQKELRFSSFASYVNGNPSAAGVVAIAPNEKLNLVLSNVSAAQAFKVGSTPFFIDVAGR